MIFRDKRFSEKVIYILTVFLFCSFYVFDTSRWGSIILLLTTIAIFMLSVMQNRGRIKIIFGSFHKFILVFVLYCVCSGLWARNAGASVQKGVTIFEILICMSILAAHYWKYISIKQLVDIVMYTGFFVAIYAIFHYGVDTIQLMIEEGERLGNSFANVNAIAMVSAVSITIAVYNVCFISKKQIYLLLFAVPAILIVAVSGSRKALILALLGITMVVLCRYTSRDVLVTMLKWCIVGAVLFIVFRTVLSLPMFAVVNQRMEGLIASFTGVGKADHSSLVRDQFVKVGMEQFRKRPVFGIGIGNSNYITVQVEGKSTYLHNNFVELLACGGIVGFSLYYAIYIYLFYKLFQYRRANDPYRILCGILMILLLIMDYGAVSYYSKNTYFYFMLFFMEVSKLKMKLKLSGRREEYKIKA